MMSSEVSRQRAATPLACEDPLEYQALRAKQCPDPASVIAAKIVEIAVCFAGPKRLGIASCFFGSAFEGGPRMTHERDMARFAEQ
jgi:hypothetical protein